MPRPGKAEQPVAGDAEADRDQQHLPERLLQHGLERLVEPAGLLRVVGEGRVAEQAADEGDDGARGIVEEGARELALAAASVVRQLGVDPARVPLALAGGLLLGNEPQRQRLLEALRGIGVVPSSVTRVSEPARGALRILTDVRGVVGSG